MTPGRNTLVLIAVAGAVLTAVMGAGVSRMRDRVDAERARICALDARIAEAELEKARIRLDEDELIVSREEFASYLKILPTEAELADFAKAVDSLSTQAGIRIRSLRKLEEPEATSDFTRLGYEIQGKGTVWQLLSFLNSLESYPRLLSVKSVEILAGEPPEADGVTYEFEHRFELTVEAHAFHPRARSARPIDIADYESRRERLRQRIDSARVDLHVGRYDFKGARARRDVFVDTRVMRYTHGPGPGLSVALREQLAIVERLAEQVRWLEQWRDCYLEVVSGGAGLRRASIDSIREFESVLDAVRGRLHEIEENNDVTYNPYCLKLESEVRGPFSSVRFALGLPRESLEEVRDQIMDALIAGRSDMAIAEFQRIRQRLAFPPNDPRARIAVKIEGLYEMAEKATARPKVRQDAKR